MYSALSISCFTFKCWYKNLTKQLWHPIIFKCCAFQLAVAMRFVALFLFRIFALRCTLSSSSSLLPHVSALRTRLYFLNNSIDYVFVEPNQLSGQTVHIWNANKCVNLSTRLATPYSKSIIFVVVVVLLRSYSFFLSLPCRYIWFRARHKLRTSQFMDSSWEWQHNQGSLAAAKKNQREKWTCRWWHYRTVMSACIVKLSIYSRTNKNIYRNTYKQNYAHKIMTMAKSYTKYIKYIAGECLQLKLCATLCVGTCFAVRSLICFGNFTSVVGSLHHDGNIHRIRARQDCAQLANDETIFWLFFYGTCFWLKFLIWNGIQASGFICIGRSKFTMILWKG